MKQVTVYVSKSVYNKLKTLAAKQDRSIQKTVARLLLSALRNTARNAEEGGPIVK